MPFRESITAKVIEAGGRLTVRSALNPILWLCGIITLPALALMPFVGPARTLFAWLAAAPVAVAIFGFLFLLFFDRDKLQSEDYQIRKRSLELIEQKGEKAIPAADVEVIADPGDRVITAGEEERS
ncbi:MAG: hypothetical protein DMG23_12130 [Acidobacteria bacterium]|nr:MAG: hypothetical protein DMG23_12130 [Acidobacteriota bacterium]